METRICKTCKIEKLYIQNGINTQNRFIYIDENNKQWHSKTCHNCFNEYVRIKKNSKSRKIFKSKEDRILHTKIKHKLRSRFYSALKLNSKNGSAVRDLGCSIQQFKLYLESKFQPGMTWDNYGFYGWHIDHIIPLSSFNLTNREELLKACHYTNLQPLWALDNWRKKKYENL